MSKLRGVLVRTESLHAWALDLGLDRALKSVHPRKAPPMGPKPLADALEALLASIYLDAQSAGLDGTLRVRELVEARFLAAIREARPGSWTRMDPKTHLQETAARLGLPAPVYTQVDRQVLAHAPRFTMQVSVGSLSGTGRRLHPKAGRGGSRPAAVGSTGNPRTYLTLALHSHLPLYRVCA